MKAFFKRILATALGMFVGSALVLFLLPVIVVLLFKGAQHGQLDSIKDKSILHLHLRGQLVERHRPLDFDLFGSRSIFKEEHSMGLYELTRAIEVAKTDKRIKGIYLEIRDFSGGWASITALHRAIEEFSKTGKWVYAYAERLDEIGYYLTTAATQSYLQPAGDLEFNGLAMDSPFLKGLFDKLEVEPRIFRVGKFKAAVEPLLLDKMSDANRLQTQTLLDDVWKSWRGAFAKKAQQDEAKIDALAANLKVVSAQDAKTAGMLTDLAYEDEIEDKMKSATVGADNELELVTPGHLLRDYRSAKKASGKKIALIFAEGEIEAGTGSMDSIGSETLRQDIHDAAVDEDVAAIVLRVNSPGGDALASDVIWRELRLTDDDMPVVVSMGDLAASGGYYIASAARYIYAEPTTITGSIGVFGVMFNTEKFFKSKTGVSFDRVVTHPHADIGSSNRPMSQVESQTIQHEVERVYKRFLDIVQDGRGFEKRSDLEQIAEGRVWSGTRAKEIGLVDEIGGLDQAIAKAAEYAELGKDYQLEVYPSERDAFRGILERFMNESVRSRLATYLGPAFAQMLKISKSVQGMKNGIYARLPFDFNVR